MINPRHFSYQWPNAGSPASAYSESMSKSTQDIATSGTWARIANVSASLRDVLQRLKDALTGRQQVVLTIFLAFLAVQVAIPLVQLAGDRPERFGWQMFSGSRTQPEFEIVKTDGSIQAVNAKDYLGYLRLEMEYADELAIHLCDIDVDTEAVRILRDGAGEVEERACQR